jgi:hypothetical protein
MVELATYENQITLKLYLGLCVIHEFRLWIIELKI